MFEPDRLARFAVFTMGSFGKKRGSIQVLSDTSTDNGAGTSSPCRMRCNRSNSA